MSAVAPLTIYDNQGTPVLQTFNPVQMTSDGTFWFEGNLTTDTEPSALSRVRISAKLTRANPVPAGGANFLYSNTGASTPSFGVNRVKFTLHVPTQLDSNTLGWIERSNFEFILPEPGSDASRGTLWALSRNLLDEAIIKAMVVNLSGLY